MFRCPSLHCSCGGRTRPFSPIFGRVLCSYLLLSHPFQQPSPNFFQPISVVSSSAHCFLFPHLERMFFLSFALRSATVPPWFTTLGSGLPPSAPIVPVFPSFIPPLTFRVACYVLVRVNTPFPPSRHSQRTPEPLDATLQCESVVYDVDPGPLSNSCGFRRSAPTTHPPDFTPFMGGEFEFC